MSKKALIIVDIQNDFVSGSLATDPTRDYVKKTSAWLRDNKSKYDVIATTQDWHIDPGEHFETWPEHCVADTRGAEINEHITSALWRTGYIEFHKGQYSDGYSGFEAVLASDNNVKLADWLKANDVSSVEIIGIATDHCVKATAIDAVKEGFDTTVLKEYVNGVSKEESARLLETGFASFGVKVK